MYLGEFGVNYDFIDAGHAVDWISAVRDAAEHFGFQWAYWSYIAGKKFAVSQPTAALRLHEWDCSPLMVALFDHPINTTDCPERIETEAADFWSDVRALNPRFLSVWTARE